jgi:hypothetical protein
VNYSFSITIEVQNEDDELRTVSFKVPKSEYYESAVGHAIGEAAAWACNQVNNGSHEGEMLGDAVFTPLLFAKDSVAKEAWLKARGEVLAFFGNDIEQEEAD